MIRLMTWLVGLTGTLVSLLIAATPVTIYLFEEGEERCVRPPYFVDAAVRHCSRKIRDRDSPPAARADALLARAAAYAEQGRYEPAIADLGLAAELTPENPILFLDRARYQAEIGRAAEALADLERAGTLMPGEPALHYTRGLVMRRLGRAEDAEAALAQAVAALSARLLQRPRFTHLYVERAKALFAQARFEDALADASRAAALEPRNREALQLRLELLERLGTKDQIEAARTAYLDALGFPVSIRLVERLLR